MSIQVALHHQTWYRFDRPVTLAPHEVRLRPAPHCRTPVLSYSLNVTPERHLINWQQDVFGNHVARLVFPQRAESLEIAVDLTADLRVFNPFDFLLESYAERYPFAYAGELARDLSPFLQLAECGPRLAEWIAAARSDFATSGTVELLANLVRRLSREVQYTVRMEPGVQDCDQTLRLGTASCRDSAWLLAQILRHLGLASRFVSGYLIQLAPDVKPLDGPAGSDRDSTDLHAWAEAYLPGAGWIGLDPTSGLFCAEGHIPLACTAAPRSAAPVTGSVEPCGTTFGFSAALTRIHEEPRTTRPYGEDQWEEIERLGHAVDAELAAGDVRLTQGGEPTFVAVDNAHDQQWNTAALGRHKWELAEQLARRLRPRFAPGGILLHSQGKWYPGEPLPRWAIGLYWRVDGEPLWRNPTLIATESTAPDATIVDARRVAQGIATTLGLPHEALIDAYEDPLPRLQERIRHPVEREPPAGPDQPESDFVNALRGVDQGDQPVAGIVLPLRGRAAPDPAGVQAAWETSRWPLRRKRLFLLPGDSAIGYRLPLDSLPARCPGRTESEPATEVIRAALGVEVRDGRVHVFLPPLAHAEAFIELVAAVEGVAARLARPVRLAGYPPPFDRRFAFLNVTPDPGVIEVNIHPAASWKELAGNTLALHEAARETRLTTEKFLLDGRHVGTGGGHHATLGGPTPEDSPLLRRPDLLASLITYWQNHPALSYLFAGMFVGPTSQAPRIDEARHDSLYELEIAFQQISLRQNVREGSFEPLLVDRLLRNLLVDVTGNTHRAEFCIDKLASPDSPGGRLGLLELRAIEMQPHPRMSLVHVLLLRALVARFWKTPYAGRLIRWGTQLHDRYMLPHFVAADMHEVVLDMQRAGYPFDSRWFSPFVEFRFPRYGAVVYDNVQLELRQALEPWNVMGEEVSAGTTARYVDSSVERLQARVTGLTAPRHLVACNGRALPLQPTGLPGEYVAGVRYRAWHPPAGLHPTIGIHAPLVFDIVDTWSGRSIGGCTYHVSHPGGYSYDACPVNVGEAEARRVARFWNHGHTPGPMTVRPEPPNPDFPLTLDLRYLPGVPK
jgi:uncharacterized protein (DUF2126 family)/transglutaminase-like putative cysteine protease